MPRYSETEWAVLRGLYESGEFTNVKELVDHCKRKLKACPSVSMVQKKMQSDGKDGKPWSQVKTDEIKADCVAKCYSDLFDRRGMGDESIVDFVVQGIKAGQDLGQKLLDAYSASQDGPISKEFAAAHQAYFENLETRRKYIELRNKLVGAAPERKKIEGETNRRAGRWDDVSDDELVAKLKEMKCR